MDGATLRFFLGTFATLVLVGLWLTFLAACFNVLFRSVIRYVKQVWREEGG